MARTAALVAIADAAAKKYGLDPKLLYAIADIESSWNTKAAGDGGKSRGIVQINRSAHPDIAQQQAEDPAFAFDWAARNMAAFKKTYPNATPQMLLMQHNAPAPAASYAKGNITFEQAEAKTGTKRYGTEAMSYYTKNGGTGDAYSVYGVPVPQPTDPAPGDASSAYGVPLPQPVPSTDVLDSLQKATSPEEYQRALNQYGFVAGFFKAVPELNKVLQEAIANKWDSTNFLGAVQNTAWFQKHTASQRAWAQLQYSDPREYSRQLSGAKTTIAQQALQMGVTLTPDRLAKMAMQQKSANWSGDELKAALQGEFHYKVGQVLGGDAATSLNEIRKIAGDFAVPMTDSLYHSWADKINSGQSTIEQFTQYSQQWAVSRHPALKSAIDGGLTVRDYLAPYASIMSEKLEIDPASIDYTRDKQIQAALNYQTTPSSDPNAKPSGVMPLWEFERQVRRDPRWLQTKNANESIFQTGSSVLKSMGLYT